MKVVHVQWVDAASLGGWRGKREAEIFIEGELNPVHTVGILVKRTKKKIVLIQTHGINEVLGLFEIPTGCVKSIKTIYRISK